MNAMIVTSAPPSEIISVSNDINEPIKPFNMIGKQNYNSIRSSSTSIPISSGPRGVIPKKPMRPLTAYHIFFQIEREYIIQSLPDNNSNDDIVTTASNKRILDDVPDRYKATKLSHDWYFGPGKRPKRKHRKAHGKIGFMELSRIIAGRWAELETLDPEVKAFVHKLAKQELDEYTEDMKKYKELTKTAFHPVVSPNSSQSAASSPVASPEPSIRVHKESKNKCTTSNKKRSLSPIAPTSMAGNISAPIDLTNEIDYFISRINNDARELLPEYDTTVSPPSTTSNTHSSNDPSPFVHRYPRQERRNSLLSFLEPLFDANELEQDDVIIPHPTKKQRRNSPASVCVDICDDEIIRMWKENNNA